MYVLYPGMYVTSVESESESVELRTTYRRNYRSNYRLNYGRGTLDRTTLRRKISHSCDGPTQQLEDPKVGGGAERGAVAFSG